MPLIITARALLVVSSVLLLFATPPLEAQHSAQPALPVATGATAPTGIVVDPALHSLDSLLTATYPASGPGAAVLVAHRGRILLRKGYGLANVELGVPLTPENILRIGSITKQFTAVATLLLADEGKLALDDEITRFFPDWPTHGHRITVEHLLTHTSGIRSYTGMPEYMTQMRRELTLEELIAGFRDQPMDFAPGTDWSYNNSGYVLLGAIIEKVSGQPYAEFLRTRLFEPLGMHDTRYEEVEAVLPRRAAGYMMSPERELRNASYVSMSLPHAAGALVSTVDDQLRWQQAVAEGRILRAETWRRAFTPVRLVDGRHTGYGHGWFVGTAAGARTIEHGGDINGFASEGLWIPEAELHIVVLSNVGRNFANPAIVAVRAAEQLLGSSARMPAVALSAEKLDEYVGVYRISENEQRVVLREGTTLYTIRGTGTRQELQPLGNDLFVYPSTATRVSFDRGADGRVAGMRLQPRIGMEQPRSPRTDETAESVLAATQATVEVPAAVLDSYVGEYELAPSFILTVRREGDGLVAQATGQPQFTLLARSETRFGIHGVPATIEFERDTAGAVTGLTLDQGGRQMPARKIR
jgi:D-alanyl-D-alanine carboxypeptidase